MERGDGSERPEVRGQEPNPRVQDGRADRARQLEQNRAKHAAWRFTDGRLAELTIVQDGAANRFHRVYYDAARAPFLVALSEGLEAPEQWAELAWTILEPQGHRLLKEGLLDLPGNAAMGQKPPASSLLPIARLADSPPYKNSNSPEFS